MSVPAQTVRATPPPEPPLPPLPPFPPFPPFPPLPPLPPVPPVPLLPPVPPATQRPALHAWVLRHVPQFEPSIPQLVAET